ncbi:hypothetical protein ALC53_05966 [Atta colombica]|uniref:Uncharacterized protein n=1 Tax=Atta colombica TaxID=520822 RepID=A0A195BHB9_9HYME|nr:hypothetical protein ALC53_05966 [Atta colombica]
MFFAIFGDCVTRWDPRVGAKNSPADLPERQNGVVYYPHCQANSGPHLQKRAPAQASPLHRSQPCNLWPSAMVNK